MAMQVVCGSANPVKFDAVANAFRRWRSRADLDFKSIVVPSGVSEQPMTLEEASRGSMNRALRSYERTPQAHYWVGIEGGVHEMAGMVYECGRVHVLKRSQTGALKASASGTIDFPIQPGIWALLKQGFDLNQAMMRLTGIPKLGRGVGYYGYFTDEAITRLKAYTDAVLVALKAFDHPEFD